MKDMGIVQGSPEAAAGLVVGKDTVYVHTDIALVPPNEEYGDAELYQYHEVQYGKDEYIHLMSERNDELDEILNTLLGVVSDG
jgi:hypothetical protein